MSEAADELERMAEEFDEMSKLLAFEAKRRDDYEGALLPEGYWKSAERLRSRAAEIRAGKPYARPQIKPDYVDKGQRWSWMGEPARIVAFLYMYEGERRVSFEDGAYDPSPSPHTAYNAILSSPDWVYVYSDSDQPQNA